MEYAEYFSSSHVKAQVSPVCLSRCLHFMGNFFSKENSVCNLVSQLPVRQENISNTASSSG